MRLPRTTLLLIPLLLLTPASLAPLAGCPGAVPREVIEANGCCRVCTTGKACGDSCIASDRTCRLAPGCACDAVDAEPAPAEHAAAARATPTECTVARIIDGDTFVCRGGERVRLLLVDAPERSQPPFGRQATAALASLLPVGGPVVLETDVRARDRYRRVLAYVYAPDGQMVNEELARQGYVVVSVHPPNVRHVERIRAAVEEARMARRGLWSSSAFECEPAEHRAGECG